MTRFVGDCAVAVKPEACGAAKGHPSLEGLQWNIGWNVENVSYFTYYFRTLFQL
jgi:hypothetical protein